MKRGITMLTGLLLAFRAGAAEPPVEFSGVLTADGKTKLALTDKASGITRWVDPGGEFKGYVVVRYEPRQAAVILRHAGEEIRLGMVAPKPPDASVPPPGPATPRATPVASPTRVPAPPPTLVLAPEPPSAAPVAVPAPPPASPLTGTVPAPQSPAGTVPAAVAPGATGNVTRTRPIQPGETLETIARTTGVTIEQLLALNPTVNAGSLQPGQVIRIR